MKRVTMAFVALGSFLFTAASAWPADFKVIANSSVSSSSISADDLKEVFLLNKNSFGGSHAQPVLEKDGAAHEAFLKQYLGKTNTALQIYYRSLVFTGKASMPKTLSGDAEMVAYVAKTKGAVGYVSAAAPTNGVKTLEVK